MNLRIDSDHNSTGAGRPSVWPTRGKLRIFLSYAAGTGKTFAMLRAAQQRRADGSDVIMGSVDTHGSTEAEALLEGLDIIPCRQIPYENAVYDEVDTDIILKRQPQIVLIDDLAHTNTPGSRHAHRYQDILELLDSGIDVYTTMNVQHLESLNDVVAQVTGITVKDTVPDHILDEAHVIELVDLPVDELLSRLAAGRVHIPPYAEEESGKFFRPGNLTALREMALRRAADHVDEQMRVYMRNHAISGPWPATERILVCVSPGPIGERLVRTARRLARSLDAQWTAAYVETSDQGRRLEADEERVAHTLRLAEQLGAQTVRLAGPSVAETLVNYALSRNVTKIVAGKPLRSRWREWLHGSVIDQILSQSQEMDVYVISGKGDEIQPMAARPLLRRIPLIWLSYFLAVGLVILATFVGLPLRQFVDPTNLVMPYLIVVILAAVWLGRWPAILASLLSVIAFDLIFVPPYYAFAVDDAEFLITFAGLLAVGMVISTLTARAQEQALAARRRESQTAALYELSQSLASVSGLDDITQTTVNHVKTIFGSPAAIFLAGEDTSKLDLKAHTPDCFLAPEEFAAAEWVFRHLHPAGRFTDTLSDARGYFLPLRTYESVLGVMAVQFTQMSKNGFADEQRRFLASFSSQLAVALERAILAEQARRTRLMEETEKLQTTLLNSISHDLRTPLASIAGALSSLLDDADLLTPAARHDLVSTAYEEALHLNRLVGNLLDMTRLESGAMRVMSQAYDVQELVGATLAQMSGRLEGWTIKRNIPNELPPVAIDLTLMMQALMNLVDNAVKHAPQTGVVEIEAYQDHESVVVAVMDRGSGLPEAELAQVFSKFYRLNAGGSGGTGLGLAIAKGIVEAHQGRIWAQNRPGGGAVFSIALPVAEFGAAV